jgi:hypothetical protein
MFKHEYDDNGRHRITYAYQPYENPDETNYVVGTWVHYTQPATLVMGMGTYIAFTTYQYPTKNPPNNTLRYSGLYADIVYQLQEVK